MNLQTLSDRLTAILVKDMRSKRGKLEDLAEVMFILEAVITKLKKEGKI